MTSNIAFSSDTVVFIDCINEECGNETHPLIPECGECMTFGGVITSRGNKALISTRRSFISGY